MPEDPTPTGDDPVARFDRLLGESVAALRAGDTARARRLEREARAATREAGAEVPRGKRRRSRAARDGIEEKGGGAAATRVDHDVE